MNKLEELRTRLGVTKFDMAEIIAIYAEAYQEGAEEADKIPEVLNKYETELLRQQEVIARLQQKNRNYRTGIKALQRAHEASLHREKALQENVSKRLDQLETEGPYSLVNFRFDSSIPSDVGY